MCRRKELIMPDCHLATGALGRCDHPIDLFQTGGNRFFEKYVRTGLHCGDSLGFMQMVRGADMHQVQLFFGKHLLPIGVKVFIWNSEFSAHQVKAFLGEIRQCCDRYAVPSNWLT